MTAELLAAIDGLYDAFAGYARLPPPRYYEAADPVGFGAPLASKPLRRLGPTDLERFKWKVLTTWGDADDFRHYLPRMLELEATETARHAGGPEVIFSRLAYAAWGEWPPAEREAVESFCRAWWADVTHSHPCPIEPQVVLCCVGQIADDLHGYLRAWQPARSRGEAMQFADWVRDVYCGVNPKSWRRFHLRNAWWDTRGAAAQQVVDWLLSPERGLELEAAFFEFGTDDETAAALSDAATELFNVRANVWQA